MAANKTKKYTSAGPCRKEDEHPKYREWLANQNANKVAALVVVEKVEKPVILPIGRQARLRP